MNPPPPGWDAADSPYLPRPDVDVAVFPTFLDLERCIGAELNAGAQCGHPDSAGAHTGDVSMAMLEKLGCAYVLCGHSERRRDHDETDAFIAEQVRAAIAARLHPIVCIGETLEEYEARQTRDVIRRQLHAILEALDAESVPPDAPMTFAYEPRWAIGTGKTPTTEEIRAVHAFIHDLLRERKRESRVLYGGSLDEKNAEAILGIAGVDGGLVGGASLKPEAFRKIVEVAAGIGRARP